MLLDKVIQVHRNLLAVAPDIQVWSFAYSQHFIQNLLVETLCKIAACQFVLSRLDTLAKS